MWSQTRGHVLALQVKYCVALSELLNLSEPRSCNAVLQADTFEYSKMLNKQKSSSFQDLFPSVLLGLVGFTHYRELEAQTPPAPLFLTP